MSQLLTLPHPPAKKKPTPSNAYHHTHPSPSCSQSRYSDIRNIPQRTTSSDAAVKPAVKKEDSQQKPSSGAELPPVSTSKIDVNAVPVYKPVGKAITQVQLDQGMSKSLSCLCLLAEPYVDVRPPPPLLLRRALDLTEHDKPWRKPGTDISDYFNYGFDEFTWTMYANKQDSLRSEYNQDTVKKMMEDTQMMMMGGMPGMGAGAAAGPMSNLPGMDGMAPEMQAMLQQMMASGLDPSQMDPAMFAGMQNAGGNAGGGQGGQNQNFGGGGQAFGAGGSQGQGYGFEQGVGRGGGGGGNFGGRPVGGRRNW